MNTDANVDASGGPLNMDISDDPRFPNMIDLLDDYKPPDLAEMIDAPKQTDMMDYRNFDSLGIDENIVMAPIEGAIGFSKCVLYPPSAPPPRIRKLPGWKTVSVYGFPKNTTDDIIIDIFGKCGEILAIRRDDDYYHIKFSSETAVDDVINLTGYRMRIQNQANLPNNGQLFIHYGETRDNKSNYQQQPLQREVDHGESSKRELPDPSPVVLYSDQEATKLRKKFNNEETFQRAVHILKTWLGRGNCNKTNSACFFTLIQAAISNVHQVLNKKQKSIDKLNKATSVFHEEAQSIKQKFIDAEKLFIAVEKVLDNFTEKQYKSIQHFKEKMEEIKTACIQDLSNLTEVDVSLKTHELQTITDQFGNKISLAEEIERLQAKIDILCYQLKEHQIKYASLKVNSHQREKLHELQLGVLQYGIGNTLRGIARYSVEKSKAAELQKDCAMESEEHSLNQGYNLGDNVQRDNLSFASSSTDTSRDLITEADVRLVCLIWRYLATEVSLQSSDSISFYLREQRHYTIQPGDMDSLLKKFPSMFKSECIGASNVVKWGLHIF